MAKHNARKLKEITSELERRGLTVRHTKKGHLLITDPLTGTTTMMGGESMSGRGNRNIHDTKRQLRRVNAHDIKIKN